MWTLEEPAKHVAASREDLQQEVYLPPAETSIASGVAGGYPLGVRPYVFRGSFCLPSRPSTVNSANR